MESKKALLFLLSGRGLQAILAVATMKTATHYLSPREMGNYYVLSSIATLFGITLISPIGQYINRRCHTWFDQGVFFNRLVIYNFYIGLVSFLSVPVILISKKYFGLITDISYFEVILLSVTSIYLNTWVGTVVPAINMLEKRIAFTMFSGANLAGGLIFSILLIQTYGAKGIYWYLGQYVLIQVFIAIFALVYLKQITNEKILKSSFFCRINTLQINNVVKFSAPLMIATFFMWLLNDSYRFIVESTLGLEALGQIAVGLSISASIFALLESMFQQIFYPKFYRKITSANKTLRLNACQELINLSFPGFTFTAIYLSCSAPFILKTLTSGNYSATYSFILFGFGISLTRVLTNIISSVAHSELDTKKLILPYVVGGGSVVIILFTLLSIYPSYLVAGLILLIVNLVVLVIMTREMNKLVALYIPWRSIFLASIVSIPFLLELFFWKNSNDIVCSIVIMVIFGLYYLFILYKNLSKIIGQS